MTSSPSAMRLPRPCTASRTRSAHHGKGWPCPVKPAQPQHINSASGRTCGYLHDTDSCIAQALPNVATPLAILLADRIDSGRGTPRIRQPSVSGMVDA